MLYVFIRTAGGITGTGEGVVPGGPWWGGESVETMQLIVERYLAPVLIGRTIDDIHRLLRDMTDVVAANLYAKAAVEVALHDAWARSLGVPVHTLLGGLARRRAEAAMSQDGVDLLRIDGNRIAEVWLFSSDPQSEDEFWGAP